MYRVATNFRSNFHRLLTVLLFGALLSGCASAPRVAGNVQQSYQITQVDVSVAPDAYIDWPAVQDAYVQQAGYTKPDTPTSAEGFNDAINDQASRQADAYNKAYKSPEARSKAAARAAADLKATLEPAAVGILSGNRSATLAVNVRLIDISSGVGRAVLGSESALVADASLVDAETGAVLDKLPNIRVANAGMSGSGAIGLAVAITANVINASQGNFYGRLSDAYSKRIKGWLRGKE